MTEETKLWCIKETQELKSRLWWIKAANWLCEYPSLKNDVIFKVTLKVLNEFYKDKISKITEEGNLIYKELGEINEQLDEYQQEFKNTFGEILKETNLLFKKFDEYEEGEKVKKLKNNIIAIMKLTQAFFQNFNEIMKDPHVEPERYPAEEPGFEEDSE